jgi:hypothetical protein
MGRFDRRCPSVRIGLATGLTVRRRPVHSNTATATALIGLVVPPRIFRGKADETEAAAAGQLVQFLF